MPHFYYLSVSFVHFVWDVSAYKISREEFHDLCPQTLHEHKKQENKMNKQLNFLFPTVMQQINIINRNTYHTFSIITL